MSHEGQCSDATGDPEGAWISPLLGVSRDRQGGRRDINKGREMSQWEQGGDRGWVPTVYRETGTSVGE